MLTYALAKSKAAKRRVDTRLPKLTFALPISTSANDVKPPLDHLIALPRQRTNLDTQTSSLSPLDLWLVQANHPTLENSSQDSSGDAR
jgi:hypothetical protein